MKARLLEFLPIVVILALVSSTAASVYYMMRLEKQEIQARAQLQLARMVEVLAEGMTEPVWTLIPEDARPLAEAMVRDDRVYRVQVVSAIQGLFLNVEESGPAPGRRSIVRHTITRDGEQIGEVEVTFDDAAVESTVSPGWTDAYWVTIANVVVALLAALLLFALGNRMRKIRERAERAELIAQRRQSEQRLAEVQRIVQIGHWYREIETDAIWLSDEAARIVGMEKIAARPVPYREFLDRLLPDDARRLESSQAAPDAGYRRFAVDIRVFRANHEMRHVAIVGQPTFDADGRPSRLEGTLQDITERKLLETQLQHSERMKAVGQLTGGIAHDFNNLLTVIRGNLQLLKRRSQRVGADHEARWIDSAIRSVDRGADLTQHLLAFARRQRLVSSVVDVTGLLAGMGEILDRVLGESITVTYRLDDDTACVIADSTELESAILNLALNARDAMPDGGRLTIGARNVVIDERDSGGEDDLVPGSYVAISVSDTGQGMSEEVRARAFEPFFTTKAEGEGTGLGLSTIFGFVKQSGGHAELRSESGSGTAVTLYFPAEHAVVPADPESSRPAAASMPHVATGERILLVDDNEAVRETTKNMLEELGYAVSTASAGKEAIDLLDNGEKVDLLFTDVVMPGGMNGLELARRARQLRPGLCVVCASGYVESAVQAVNDDAAGESFHWIDKPFDLEGLALRLREALS